MKYSNKEKVKKKRVFQKIITISLILLIILIYFLYFKQTELIPTPQEKTLSELQVTACNAADRAQTCNSRLVELGIVTKEECCEVLGKCC